MEIIQKPSPNFKKGTGQKKIAIVNHITSGPYPGCLAWMQNPKSKASAQYLVTRAGLIIQMVKDEDAAYHAGQVNKPNWPLYNGKNPNFYTIGIEHEEYSGDGELGLTEAQYQATLWLHRQLIAKHCISVDRDHIIGHYRIDSVNRPNCPGPYFPWQRLFADLTGAVIQGKVKISILGKALEGVIIEGHSFALAKAIAESLGKQVNWDEATKTVLIPPISVPITPTSYAKIAAGSQIIPAKIIDGRAFAQVGVLCQALGYTATWENNMVIVR